MNESVSAEGNSTSPAGPAPSGDMSVDLRDNQLDELPSQAAPSSSTVFGSGPDSLQGATVNSATQSVLAGLLSVPVGAGVLLLRADTLCLLVLALSITLRRLLNLPLTVYFQP